MNYPQGTCIGLINSDIRTVNSHTELLYTWAKDNITVKIITEQNNQVEGCHADLLYCIWRTMRPTKKAELFYTCTYVSVSIFSVKYFVHLPNSITAQIKIIL